MKRKKRTKKTTRIKKDLTLEEFFEIYKPVKNTIVPREAMDGCLFETFGPEQEHVFRADPKTVWTWLDSGEVVPGRHIVNRQGYFITAVPYPASDIQVNRIDEDDVFE